MEEMALMGAGNVWEETVAVVAAAEAADCEEMIAAIVAWVEEEEGA